MNNNNNNNENNMNQDNTNNSNENNMSQNDTNNSNEKLNSTSKGKKSKKKKHKDNLKGKKSEGTSQEKEKSTDKTDEKSSKKQQDKSTEYKKKILKEANIDIEELLKALNVNQEEEDSDEPSFDEATLTRVRIFLSQINEIRVQLARLDTNLAGVVYYENEVFPVLNVLFLLSTAAGEYGLIARNISQISVAKTSKVKDMLDLTYDLEKLSEIVFDVAECKVKKFLRIIGK